MYFLLMALIALIPLITGIAIIFLLHKNTLSYILFLFLLFTSLWQFDVAILYSHSFLSLHTIDVLFRLFRIGSIMMTATLFHVAYVILRDMLPNTNKSRWRYILNSYSVVLMYAIGIFVYIIGWSHRGINKLILISANSNTHFLFPEYGDLAWIYQFNLFLYSVSISFCLLLSFKMTIKSERNFLINFIMTLSIGYAIGILNLFPQTRLFPSSIAVIVLAVSTLILVTKMHTKIVQRMTSALEQQRTFLRDIIDLNPNYIYAKNEKGEYILVNKAFSTLFGTTPDRVVGKTYLDILNDEEQAKITTQQEKELFKHFSEKYIVDEVIRDASGHERWLETSKIPIVSNEEKFVLGVSIDITERKKHEEEMTFRANHDVLTGLPNKRKFNEDLEFKISRAETFREEIAVLLLDLDRFKNINDTLGHDVGDQLLIEVTKRLTGLIGNKENGIQLYRIGGDEFTIIASLLKRSEANILAKQIIDAFEVAFTTTDHTLFITASIGMSIFPINGKDVKTLTKHADAAMYHVKENGKNAFQIFTREINQHLFRKMVLEKELRKAIKNHEMTLWYQPQFDITEKKMVGVEALARWDSKELGRIFPVEFIPVAEETGLILTIGDWILKKACTQIMMWIQAGYSPLKLAVNISTRQFLDYNFIQNVQNTLTETNIPAHLLELELTESIAIKNQEEVIKKLQQIRDLGISIAIDNFGTGYSSLSYLKKYPIQTLKVDKSFIHQTPDNKENAIIIKSILSVSKHLNINVIAEGVETEDELRFLRDIGWPYIQGYYISEPLSPDEFEKRMLQQ